MPPQVELNNSNECIFEVSIQNEKVYIISLYRSPSQPHDEHFLLNFEQIICDIIVRNPFFVLITGNFNARAVKWWKNDLTATEGVKIELITTSRCFSYIISNPAHILPNYSLYIDLIFTI